MPTLDDLPTPALLLDLDRLDANIAGMANRCAALGVRLRPHAKTHKCVEVAVRQRAAGARGLTVSTLDEAAVFARHGFDDITWAFPVIPSRLDEATRLTETVRLGLTVDGPDAVDALERRGTSFSVWIKIDCGYHRAGMDPTAPGTLGLARRLADSRHLRLAGLLTHSGHAYAPMTRPERRAIAERERRAVAEVRARLAEEGIAAEASVGSTPAMAVVESLDGVTEARPGNYVFYDATQAALGSCPLTACAVTVLATVVSAQPGARRAVVDAGALALSKDAGPPGDDRTMGCIVDRYQTGTTRADVRLAGLSQEHGLVEGTLSYGTRVRIIPNHACLAAACFDEYWVVRGEAVVDRWRIHRTR